MPIAHIYILEGRTAEQRAKAIKCVTDALSEALDSPKERIRVLLHEMPADHWGIAGVAAGAQESQNQKPPEAGEWCGPFG
jgi:4-oxalocrotonate tautomerase